MSTGPTTTPRDEIPLPPTPLAPPMAVVVRRGMSIFALLNIVSKVGAFAANIALAWLLAPHDFGVYGAAIAVSALVGILRDGGVRELLVQRGPEHYRTLSGPVFWYGLCVTIFAGALLALLSPLLASFYKMPDLTGPLIIIAISLPVGVPGAILRCKLRIDLRFGALGNIWLINNTLRYSTTILFAWLGAGAMSFVIPFILIGLYEWAAAAYYTGENPLRGPLGLARWREIFHDTKWLIVGALAFMMVEQGDYLVAARFIDETTLGLYFFAAQLLFQTAYSMLSFTAQLVLFPSLVRLAAEPDRQRQAALRFLGALMLVASPMAIGFAVVAEPLFGFMLQPKWHPSILPLQILALLYPHRCTIGLTTSVLLAQGHFRRNAAYMLCEGALLLAVSAGAAGLWGTPVALATGVGLTLTISRLVICALTFHSVGARVIPVLATALYAWTLALVCAGATLLFDDRFLTNLPNLPRLALTGALFTLLYAVLTRIVSPGQLREALVIVPTSLRPFAARLLLLT